MILIIRNMPLLKNFKTLKASSVMESVIAISVISVCSLVAFLIYLNVIKQNKSIHYFNAKHSINLLTEQSVLENNYENDTYTFNSYTISKEVTINKAEQTALLKFTIKSGNSIDVINKLITYYDN
ncbi:hypothetical protein [Algibacter sp. 2305UL17-15]|uniref:hypothetical protein n=1 Tax=Algibacter sp. 2305UL17-15 TaxID=3231268 RepID=UPI0034592274